MSDESSLVYVDGTLEAESTGPLPPLSSPFGFRNFHIESLPVAWLFAGSVLQAMAAHVRRGRGLILNPPIDMRNLEELTVGTLAVTFREHPGSAGQGFEFAVIDAINFGFEPIVTTVQEALSAIGVPMDRPRAVAMGLEKIAEPDRFLSELARQLPDHRLLSGHPGRPPGVPAALKRLLHDGVAIRQGRGALAFADVLLYDAADQGSVAVTGSIKINGYGWRPPNDPPRVWIIGSRRPGLDRTDYLPPSCAVAYVAGGMAVYEAAYAAVTTALRRIDRGRPPEGALGRILTNAVNRPVGAVIQELYDRAYTVYDAYLLDRPPAADVQPASLLVPLIDTPQHLRRYEHSQTDSGLTVLTSPSPLVPNRQFFTTGAQQVVVGGRAA